MIEYSYAVFLMFRKEVEVGSAGCLVDVIGLPNAILEFNYNFLNHQGQGDICLNFHIVLKSEEELAVSDLFFA